MKKPALLNIILFFLLFSSLITGLTNNLGRAIELFDEGKFVESKILLEKILDVDHDNTDAYYYLGRIYLNIEDHDKAIKYLKKAIKLKNDEPNYHFWLSQSYQVKAAHSSKFKQLLLFSKIKNELEKTINFDPNNEKARIQLITFYLMMGAVDKAYPETKILLESNEKWGRFLLAQIYEKESKTDSAEAEYRLIESTYGDSTSFYFFYNNYGYLLLNQKRYDEAIEKFNKQITLAPDSANTYDSLGDAYRACGKLQAAINEYQTALKIDPNFKSSKKKIKELEKELNDNKK